MSKFSLSRRRVVAAGVAIATVIGFSAASTIATNASASAKAAASTTTVTIGSLTAGDTNATVSASVSGSDPTGTVSFSLWDGRNCNGTAHEVKIFNGSNAVTGALTGSSGTNTATSAAFTAPAAGTYWWLATYGGDTANQASSSDCTSVTVSGPVNTAPQISWSNPSDIVYGTALSGTQLNASATGADGKPLPGTFTYMPASGTKLDAGPNQTLSVTFTPNDTKNYSSATQTVSLNVKQATPVVTWPAQVDLVYNAPLTAANQNAAADVSGTFVYGFSTGDVLSAGTHTLTATFTPTDSKNYASVNASVDITVNPGSTSVTWSDPANVVAGTVLGSTQLDAVPTQPGTCVYTPAAGTVVAAGDVTLSVTCTPTNTSYLPSSANVTLHVDKATPALSTAPTAATVVLGGSISDGVTVTGGYQPTGTATFAVYGPSDPHCKRTPLASNTISLSSGAATSDDFTPPSTGKYRWTVSYSGDANNQAATSACGDLTKVNQAPAITTQPSDSTVASGTTAVFTASASGTPKPHGQWQIESAGTWTDIKGAKGDTLSVSAVTTGMDGNVYRVVYRNSAGTAASDPVTLTVTDAPTVSLDPAPTTVVHGNNATFTSTADGYPTPTVQWQSCAPGADCSAASADWTDVVGGTATTLTVAAAPTSADGTQYRAVFTNRGGTVTSDSATLNVPEAPAITLDPSNVTAAVTSTVSFTAAASGTPAPTVQWEIQTAPGVWSPVGGATSPTLTLSNVLGVMNGNQYRAVFTNSTGTATSKAATLTVTAGPSVVQDPADTTVVVTHDAAFTATASGLPSPSQQWQSCAPGADCSTAGSGWSNVTGGTGATLTVPAVALSLSGTQYRAVFSNSTGTAYSRAAMLTVTPPAPVALPGSVPGTPGGALDGVPGTTNPGQTFTATGTGFAPFATVNFGIYSSPLLLATVSADASGVAKATITIPADFTGVHTVVAAGTGASGSPLYLAAGTTVVAKSTPTPAGSSSHGVGGVSTSRGPRVGPNAGSSSGLANTGARVNPVALTQIGLLALLVGGGLLLATRRRARRH